MGTEPKRYRAWFIEPGIISYEDVGAGTVLVSREALDNMRPSFVGMPVFNFSHKDIDAEAAFDFDQAEKDSLAVGIVSEVGTNGDPGTDHFGWDYADMLVWDQETQRNIDERGFSVSCAYTPTETKGPGDYHGIGFDEEVVNGEYMHMAIVENPRYEGSTIFANSKGDSIVAESKRGLWNIFIRKNSTAEPPKAEEKKPDEKKPDEGAPPEGAENAAGGAFVEIGGQKVPLEELLDCYMQKANGEGEGQALAPEDEVDLPDGGKVKVADLIKAYQGGGNANSEVAEPGTAAEPVVQNAKSAKEAPNENFLAIRRNAAAVADPPPPKLNTRGERLAAGASRYGSAVAVAAGGVK